MKDYVLMTDSDTEIPYEYADANNIPVFLMPYTVDGVEKLYDLGRSECEKEFYQKLRSGANAFTSTRSPADIADFFRGPLKEGKDILYLCFSSELSGHYNLSLMAREEVQKEFPEARIVIVDTLRISMPAGMLVIEANKRKLAGGSLDEVADWVEKNKLRANGWFLVDDLSFLKRGGRLSGTQAFVGSLLEIKPILNLNREGKVVNVDKVNGRKRGLKYLVDKVVENIEEPEDQEMFIMHADALEAAEELKRRIEEAVKVKKITIKMVGPVIGCHGGPDLLAAIFIGKECL
jgi:DegV family protein with EDD domain